MMVLEDPFVAYCFDQAVGHIGRSIDADLEGVEADNAAAISSKRQQILDRYFGVETPSKGTYADPAAMMNM